VRIKPKEWEAINDNPDHPLMNKAIQDQQPPGSTFKPFTALAGLESGAIDEDFSVNCGGGVALYGIFQKCWVYPHGHGRLSLHRGIVDSCDVYFYTVGAKTGIDNLSFYGDLVGFGHLTGIDLPHENAGVMPSAQWKLRNFREKWYAGETPSVAIGQGAVTVTPLQLARALGGVAEGGVWHRPHLVKTVPDSPVEWKLNPDDVKAVVDGMYGVVNEGGGTGGRARLPNIQVCGKTGTAQLTSENFAKASGKKTSADNAWFEAFAPCINPEIVVVALYEHFPGHGQFAAPVVRDVIKAYFDKKARIAAVQGHAPQNQQAALPEQGPGAGGQGPGISSPVTGAVTAAAADTKTPSGGEAAAGKAPGPRPPTPSAGPPAPVPAATKNN
jgi:penicillin-binding protein 2